MFIAGYDVKQIVGAILIIALIFAGMFATAGLIRNLGYWTMAKNATERGLWTWRWLRPALALILCVAAVYVLLAFVL